MNYKRLFVPDTLLFITVVTKDRKNILISNVQFLKEAFRITMQKYSFEIIAIVVNHDHLHMIIKPEKINEYPKIIGSIKRNFTKISNIQYSLNKNGESDIWQRRYWEHTIMSEEDLYRHIDYIHYNSMKHYNIAPRDWSFSSFNRFVKNGYYDINWCNFGDKYRINDLHLE